MEEYETMIDLIKNTRRGKEWFNISDLSRLFNLTSETLRKYEKKHIVEPLRTENNYRIYSSWEITKIIRARQLKSECSSLVEVDEHMLEMDSDESVRNIELRQKALSQEIENKKRLLTWLTDRKEVIENYKNNRGKVYLKKEEKIYCNIYMVGNTITDKTGEDLKQLQRWMAALPYTSVYYVGIRGQETISCVGITESERKAYHLEDLKADFVIPACEYMEYDDYATHSSTVDTSMECIEKGYEMAEQMGIELKDIFVVRMIEYVQKQGIYKSHNLMMYPVKNH